MTRRKQYVYTFIHVPMLLGSMGVIKLGDLIVNTLEDYLGNHNLEHQVSLVKVFSTSAIFECAPIIFICKQQLK